MDYFALMDFSSGGAGRMEPIDETLTIFHMSVSINTKGGDCWKLTFDRLVSLCCH